MKGAFRVRKATSRDIEVLTRQRHSMLTEMRPRTDDEMKVHDAAFKRWAANKMRAGEYFPFLVVDSRGRPVAGGAVWLREHQPSPGRGEFRVPYLLSVYTEPGFRRRGLATLLLTHANRWAKRNGYDRIVLHASEMGRPVYERFGYKGTNEMEYRLPAGLTQASTARPRRSGR